MIKYSIVIPCYKSSETIGTVVSEMIKELCNDTIEFILVNDGSPDGGLTLDAINKLSEKYENVCAIDLAKNSGQHNAILCALSYVSGEYIICMDDDMQTHPSQVHKLIDKIHEGYDVVYADYVERKQNLFRKMGSTFNSFCEYLFIGKPKGLHTNSYFIMRSFVKDYLVKYQDSHTYLDGLVMRTTHNICNVPVEHFERVSGSSGYTLTKLIKHWFDIIGFTVSPLKLAFGFGSVVSAGSIIAALVIVIKKLFFGVSATGWTSIMVALCLFSGLLFLFVGLLGEYIGRIFLLNTSHPQYVIRSIKGNNTRGE